jgi:hydrogenase/urease accessory protein HupE
MSGLWRFFSARKKYWLMPMIVASALIVGLLLLSQGLSVVPFRYSLF